MLAESGKARGEAGDEEVLSLARGLDPEARIVQLDMGDGDGVVFDGRLWHASNNTLPRGRRLALLLQYADAGSRIEQPDLTQLEWPFGDRGEPAPSILVSGAPNGTPNRLVPAPAAEDSVRLGPEIRDLGLSLAEDPATAWRPHPQFAGATPNVTAMGCHVSVLSPGHSPHPPPHPPGGGAVGGARRRGRGHLPGGPVPRRGAHERLGPGDFVYHPAYQHHTVRNAGKGPLSYLMLKWRGEPEETEPPPGSAVVRPAEAPPPGSEPVAATVLHERPTAFLAQLHSHLTVVQPGAGYEAHVDDHDVAIVVLSGRVRVLGARPAGTACCTARRGADDMENPGAEPARYLVFEFHAARRRPEPPAAQGRPAEDLAAERDRLARELHTVLTSSSWRLTAPLRRAVAAVRAARR